MDRPNAYRLITAYVRLGRRQAVNDALRTSQAGGFTHWEVSGAGEQTARLYDNEKTLRYEVVVGVNEAERVADAIIEAVRTGHAGDGIVFVTPIEGAWQVRTMAPL